MTAGGRGATLTITLAGVRGELRVTSQGLDLVGLDPKAPMTGVRALIAELRRLEPARGRPVTVPGDIDLAEVTDAVRGRQHAYLPVTLLDVALDVGTSRSTLGRALVWYGVTLAELLDRDGPSVRGLRRPWVA